MADPDDEEDQGRGALQVRMADAWRLQRRQEFYVLVAEELIPRITRGLRRGFSTLSDEDLEDCISAAVTVFVDRDKHLIDNPYSYMWSMAKRQALDLVEERAKGREAVEELGVPEIQAEFIETRAATILIEGVVEDVEADVSWAVDVVAIAVSRLRPALGRVIAYVLANGTNCDAKTAAVVLGTTAVTFRANKSKGYEALRALIPVAIAEKGITLPSPRLVEVFTERHDFGKDDE